MKNVTAFAVLSGALLVCATPAWATTVSDGAAGNPGLAAGAGAPPVLSSKATARRVIVRAKRSRAGSDEPALRSSSALVMDESTADVLFSKHADLATPIASITKLMTALVVLEASSRWMKRSRSRATTRASARARCRASRSARSSAVAI